MKAAAIGLTAEPYRYELAHSTDYTGVGEIEVSAMDASTMPWCTGRPAVCSSLISSSAAQSRSTSSKGVHWRTGTGKSALALAAGREMPLERLLHKKNMVFRSLYAVGGQDLGYPKVVALLHVVRRHHAGVGADAGEQGQRTPRSSCCAS